MSASLLTLKRNVSERFPGKYEAKQSRCHLINHPDVDVVIMIASLTDDIEYGSAKVSYFLRLSATDINLNHLRQNHPIYIFVYPHQNCALYVFFVSLLDFNFF